MLKTRVITALLLVAGLALVLFFLPPPAVVLAFAAIAGLAGWEWAGLMGATPLGRQFFAALLVLSCGVLHYAAVALVPPLLLASAAFWVLAVPWLLGGRQRLMDTPGLGYAVGVVVILPTWAAMVMLQALGSWVLLAAMALVWVADIAAYFAGRAFGKHKLAPRVSPGKTWEGVAGAVLGVIVYGSVVTQATPLAGKIPLGLVPLLAVLVALTALSVIGDLFESLLKRQAQIKDSSNLLPGHGGVLDRIDALTSTLPFFALMSLLWPSST